MEELEKSNFLMIKQFKEIKKIELEKDDFFESLFNFLPNEITEIDFTIHYKEKFKGKE